MGKFLEAFLTEQLHIDGVEKPRTPKHRKLCDRAHELHEALEKKLNTEEKELLTELIDVIFNEGNVDAEKKFERGYRLGVLMTAEIFMEQDTFL
ncbi:MAG: hypothetical protein K1W41_12110 [Lachnospiraceae bacterium]